MPDACAAVVPSAAADSTAIPRAIRCDLVAGARMVPPADVRFAGVAGRGPHNRPGGYTTGTAALTSV
ncbi:hypothetical protein ACRAWF_04615 [Streptomyces sp. L7]